MNKANSHAHNTNYCTQFLSSQCLGWGLHGDEAKLLLLTPTFFVMVVESLTVELLQVESLTVEILMIESLYS